MPSCRCQQHRRHRAPSARRQRHGHAKPVQIVLHILGGHPAEPPQPAGQAAAQVPDIRQQLWRPGRPVGKTQVPTQRLEVRGCPRSAQFRIRGQPVQGESSSILRARPASQPGTDVQCCELLFLVPQQEHTYWGPGAPPSTTALGGEWDVRQAGGDVAAQVGLRLLVQSLEQPVPPAKRSGEMDPEASSGGAQGEPGGQALGESWPAVGKLDIFKRSSRVGIKRFLTGQAAVTLSGVALAGAKVAPGDHLLFAAVAANWGRI